MAHLTLYIDDDLAARVRETAESEGVSQSRWVAELIAGRLSADWPRSVVSLAGAWPDLPPLEELRAEPTQDTSRERL
jgi:hypothetical protein